MDNAITVLLCMAFLFFVGSTVGWCIEVLFRRFFSAKKWINPGFLTGPYLPLYGFGLTGLYLICFIPVETGRAWLDAVTVIFIMGVAMTVIEYIAGVIFIKGMKIKLWDYSDRPGNIQGIICPLFSLFWTAVGAIYYFVINPFVMAWVAWFVNHIAFAFVVGMFFGVFFVDLAHSIGLSVKITQFAKKYKTVISFEKLKESIKDGMEKSKEKARFWFSFKTTKTIQQHLAEFLKARDKKREAAEEGEEKKP